MELIGKIIGQVSSKEEAIEITECLRIVNVGIRSKYLAKQSIVDTEVDEILKALQPMD